MSYQDQYNKFVSLVDLEKIELSSLTCEQNYHFQTQKNPVDIAIGYGVIRPNQAEGKIEYLGHAYSYLTQHFCSPIIYVACYNDNYEVQLHNVHNNWGFSFFQFISPKEMYQCITTRKH